MRSSLQPCVSLRLSTAVAIVAVALLPARSAYGPDRSYAELLGGMFWLSENTLSGSYLSFSATSRANFSSP